MSPEGMVHALEVVNDLLVPGGQLIDIHPSGQAPPIELLDGNALIPLGYVHETDDFIEYAQADAALAQAVANGWFNLERQKSFTFATYARSVTELWDFLSQTWSDAILPDQSAAQAIEAHVASPIQKVVITENIRLSLLARQPPIPTIST